MPLVLPEYTITVRANVGGRFAELEVLVGVAHHEIGKVIARVAAVARTVEVELAVHVEVVNGVVVIGGVHAAELQRVFAPDPADRVGEYEGVVHQVSGSLGAEADGQAAVKSEAWRTGRIIRNNVDAQ